MTLSNFQPAVEILEPRLLLDAGWALNTFARWYGGASEAYGPESDIVVRVTGSGTSVTVATQATDGGIWSSNDLLIKTSGGSKRVLTNSDDDGTAPALVGTSSGHLRAAWYNATDQSLMFAAQGHNSWSSNSPITLDSGNVGEWSDLALEADGDLHLAYYDRANGAVKYAYHADADSWYTWTIETIDTVGDITTGLAAAEVAAVAVDSNGTPHVAYYSAIGTQLEYAYRTGADTWVNTVLDSDGDVGADPSIAIDGSNVVHLVYYDTGDLTLRYNTKTGAGWTGAQVVEGPTGAAEPFGPNSLALDALGNPHVAYTYTLSTNGKNLKHAWIDTGAWTNETVDSDGTGQHGYYPSLVITQAGHAYIAYGINWTHSIYVADKAGVGEPGGPDLAVSISDTGGQTYLPGDMIESEVTITNVGLDPATGDVDLDVGVAIDTGGGFQYKTPYRRIISVDLAPGESTTIMAAYRVADDALPAEIYQIASIDPDNAVGDTIPGNNDFTASTADQVVWAVGDVDGRTVRTLTIEDPDDDGDQVTFSLKGAGSMSIMPGDNGIDEIVIDGTNSKTVVTIVVKGGNGETSLENLIVQGDVSKISAPGIFITGDVTIDGFCKTLILGTVDNGHTITINDDQVPVDPADLAKNAVALIFDNVASTDVNTNGLAVRSIKALDWNGGSITAPWIGSMNITGTRDGAFAGNLGIDLILNGDGSPKQTLGNVKVTGEISGGSWDITGNVGAIRAGAADQWTVQVASDLKSLSLSGAATNTTVIVDGLIGSAAAAEWLGGGVTADQLKRFTVKGSKRLALDGDCTMTLDISGEGVLPGKTAVGGVMIKGVATDTTVTVDGPLGPVTAAEWSGGGITADQMKKLTIGGSKLLGLGGDCTMTLDISGEGVLPGKTAVGSIVIKGVATNVDVSVDGWVGSATAAEWNGGGITADALRKLSVPGSKKLQLDGNCDMSVAISGDGVLPAKTAVGGVHVKGGASLQMDVIGAVGTLQAATFHDNTNVNVSQWIQSMIATGEIGGDYAAGRINSVKTRGDFTASFALTQTPDPKVMALGRFNVAGRMNQARISTAGNIGIFQTGTLTNSTVFAGWDSTTDANGDDVFDLFDVGDTFNHHATIKKLTIKGVPGQQHTMANSNVVAATVEKFYVGEILIDETPGAEPFGLACETYSLIVAKDSDGIWTLHAGEGVDPDGNFVVRLV